MSGSGVRERPGLAPRVAGPAFDLVVSKLRCPPARPGTVFRSLLVERLAAALDALLIPAGRVGMIMAGFVPISGYKRSKNRRDGRI